MNIKLYFKNIVDQPQCRIFVNTQEVAAGLVQSHYSINAEVNDGIATLIIEHCNKRPEDTVVKNGIIVRDRSFELDRIEIDGYDLEELKWDSEFHATDGAVYPSCLFFGPNGKFILNFESPALRWILKMRHEKNNNDPHWEEDYNYYTQACRLLTRI